MMLSKKYPALLIVSCFWFLSCESYLDIDPPIDNIVSTNAFSTDEDIEANIAGLHSYNLLSSSYHDVYRHLYIGLAADEMVYYTSQVNHDPYVTNTIIAENNINKSMYSEPYKAIYQSNLMLAELQKENVDVTASVRDIALGTSYFFRAFSYINLVTLFGDVPLVTDTRPELTRLLPRAPKSDVLALAIEDLINAKELLKGQNKNYGWASQAAASALLARAYLYAEKWQEAASEASELLDNKLDQKFTLEDIGNVFKRGSQETIFAIYTDGSNRNVVNHTFAGRNYVASSTRADYTFRPEFIAAFEEGDLRKSNWVKQFSADDPNSFYPYKYKLKQAPTNAADAEDQVLIRLAELYLIRAEAYAHLSENQLALADLNTIRQRSGLGELNSSLDSTGILLAVEKERRLELFLEYGHRWVDLVRTGRADAVLGALKSTWQSTDALFPIPSQDIQLNSNLVQNPGYN